MTCLVGQALVRAAIDWRRVGLVRPVPEVDLKQLYPAYVPELLPGVELSDEHYQAGLGWATAPLASRIALLNRVEVAAGQHDAPLGRAFEPFDYLVEQTAAEPERYPVPPSTWQLVVAASTPEEILQIGLAIYAPGVPEIARRAWAEAAAASGDQAVAALAALQRGDDLVEQGDLSRAWEAYGASRGFENS